VRLHLRRLHLHSARPADGRAEGLGAGLTEWFASALIGLYQDYRRSGTGGYAAEVTSTVTRLTGRAPRTLDELLAEPPAGTKA
jgi:hypothetical protein